jgi:hypothetical protein
MDVDDFVSGVVAALLTDQVDEKTGLAFKVGWVAAAVALLATILTGGWLRAFALIGLLLTLAFLVFVFVSKRIARAVIGRLAPPADISNARANFETAVAEADIPTGPTSLLRLVWRLRKGIGPEVERLAAVVNRMRADLG